jgi:UPF0716 protein FxsA
MTWLLALVLLVVPTLELGLIVSLNLALPVVGLQAIATAAVGWWFSRGEDLSLWSELESDIQNGRVPTEEALDAMLTVLGGWALIVPGFLTDLAGGVLLVPAIRGLLIGPIRGMIRQHLV